MVFVAISWPATPPPSPAVTRCCPPGPPGATVARPRSGPSGWRHCGRQFVVSPWFVSRHQVTTIPGARPTDHAHLPTGSRGQDAGVRMKCGDRLESGPGGAFGTGRRTFCAGLARWTPCPAIVAGDRARRGCPAASEAASAWPPRPRDVSAHVGPPYRKRRRDRRRRRPAWASRSTRPARSASPTPSGTPTRS